MLTRASNFTIYTEEDGATINNKNREESYIRKNDEIYSIL